MKFRVAVVVAVAYCVLLVSMVESATKRRQKARLRPSPVHMCLASCSNIGGTHQVDDAGNDYIFFSVNIFCQPTGIDGCVYSVRAYLMVENANGTWSELGTDEWIPNIIVDCGNSSIYSNNFNLGNLPLGENYCVALQCYPASENAVVNSGFSINLCSSENVYFSK